MKDVGLIITCEHAFNHLPKEYQLLFWDKKDILESHRGWDPGAFELAEYLSKKLNSPFFYGELTRLLIELNRSLHHEQLFSEFSQTLSADQKNELLTYYHNYRNSVISKIDELFLNNKKVIHLSIHTFTPVLNGEKREADIGILFDPDRAVELEFSAELLSKLQNHLPNLKIMFNSPYLGIDDGFTTFLRKKYIENYVGVELEINQKFIGKRDLEEIKEGLYSALV